MSIGAKIKRYSRYLLPPFLLQDITWIYHISQLMKHLVTYWWKTWVDWYQDNIIITKTNDISVNIVYMAAPVKRYWKTIWEDASYPGHKKSSFQKLMTIRGVIKSSLQKQNTNYVYLLSSTQISKVFHVSKTRVNHRHWNPSPPIPASRTMWVLSATTIIWQVNIEVQLRTHATWITTLIQRTWKFHASFTTSKVYCFYFIAIFMIACFWNSF